MCIVSKHLKKVLSALKNMHFDLELWIRVLKNDTKVMLLVKKLLYKMVYVSRDKKRVSVS